MGETSNIDVIQSWINELNPKNHTLTEKWTTGDSHRLVYDIGGPQHLEVHNAFFIELDGRPMQVPACVVTSGRTDFEFFDDKAGLFAFLGPKAGSSNPDTNTGDINSIKQWVEDFKSQNTNIQINEAPEDQRIISGYAYYNVTKQDGNQRLIQISPRGSDYNASVSFFDGTDYEFFNNKSGLLQALSIMLRQYERELTPT